MPARKTSILTGAEARDTSKPLRKEPLQTFSPMPAIERTSITSAKPKNPLPQNVVRIFLPLLGIAACASAGYFYYAYRTLARDPAALQARQTQDLVAKVGTLIVLPDEAPTVATVSDASKVRDQKFFAGAQNGDTLLAYPKAMEAILYRPSQNKIIAVAPIVLGQNTTAK